MRHALIVLALALAAVACTREQRMSVGQIKPVIDQGVQLQSSRDPAPEAQPTASAEPAAPGRGKAGKAAKSTLPATLGGDTEHRNYSGAPQPSPPQN